jgi:CBS domain-containing protein
MNVKVKDLMREQVVTAQPHHTVAHVRGLLERNHIHAVPVVDTDGRPVGIVSTSDLLGDVRDGAPVRTIMTDRVLTVPAYDDVSTAARVMRNHQVHRVIVTDEQRVIGVLSAFDLLQLVEDRRFIAKNPPTPSPRKGSTRA